MRSRSATVMQAFGMPALMAANKVQAKREKRRKPVSPQQHVDRLKELLEGGLDPEAAIGQLLYDVVTLSRQLDVDPELALCQVLIQRAHDE